MSSKTINAYCTICGKGYHVCKSCREMKDLGPWRMVADNPNCYLIYTTLSRYNGGLISKDEARELLEKRDLRDRDTFKERVRSTIDKIMDEPKRARRVTKQPVVEVVSTDDAEPTGVSTTDIADSADTDNCEQN